MSDRIPDREITPREVYFNRRTFLRAGLLTATAAGTALAYRKLNTVALDVTELPAISRLITAPHADGFWVDEALTPRASILHYNNFYEFSTDKDGVASAAAGFKTDGWQVAVGGLVRKPRVFDLDDLRRLQPARRARLPHALRRGVVDGDPVGRLFAVEAARGGRADRQTRSTSRSRRCSTPQRMPEPERPSVLDVAVRRGPPRIDEAMHPLDAPRDRPLRPGAAAAGRRAGAAGHCRGNTASRASSRSSRSR